MEEFLKEMLIVVTCCGIAFVFYVIGYDAGHSDSIKEACESIEYARLELRQLEESIRTSRIENDILRRKYNDLQRKIKAMEGESK